MKEQTAFYTVNQLKPHVYHIADPMGVCMTLIIGEEKALLLDTGYGTGNLHETVREITDLPLIVVNSHGHLDHILGNRFFDTVYLHPADLPLYRQHSSKERRQSIANRQRTRPRLFPEDFSPEEYLADLKTEVIPVDEGIVFDLGGVRLTVIHIPGHTPGGIALLDDRDKLLLTGDMVSAHIWMFLPESTGMGTYIESLRKVQQMSSQYDGIVASHVQDILPNDMVVRLIHCAAHIDPEASIAFEPPFEELDRGWMYYEGLESLREALGMETLDLSVQPFSTLNLDKLNFKQVTFVSIAYDLKKL